MKKKEIGQCKDCKWLSKPETNCAIYCTNKRAFPYGMFYTSKTFGCWYWKEKGRK